MTVVESLISFNGIYLFSYTKNGTGMASSDKAVSGIVEFPTFFVGYDGEHVVLQCPRNTASEYVNYKIQYTFSILLFAVIDAHYNFILYMSTRDIREEFLRAAFLRSLSCIKKLETKTLSSSAYAFKRERKTFSMLFFIGDEAFPLVENLIKIYLRQH
jgi:hypothetical protein